MKINLVVSFILSIFVLLMMISQRAAPNKSGEYTPPYMNIFYIWSKKKLNQQRYSFIFNLPNKVINKEMNRAVTPCSKLSLCEIQNHCFACRKLQRLLIKVISVTNQPTFNSSIVTLRCRHFMCAKASNT